MTLSVFKYLIMKGFGMVFLYQPVEKDNQIRVSVLADIKNMVHNYRPNLKSVTSTNWSWLGVKSVPWYRFKAILYCESLMPPVYNCCEQSQRLRTVT